MRLIKNLILLLVITAIVQGCKSKTLQHREQPKIPQRYERG